VTDHTHVLGGAPAPAQNAPQVRWIAHRGWSTRFPENSLAALAAAISAGADEIEFDVRLTRDDVAVVIHDPIIDRVSTSRGRVADLDAREVLGLTRVGPGDMEFPGMGLEPLARVLEMFAPHAGMNVHVKDFDADGRVLGAIAEAARANPRSHIYIAGNEDVLEQARALYPDVRRFCLARQREPAALIATALEYACHGLQFRSTDYDASAVAEARSHGLLCNLFYADTADDASAAIAAGIDGVLTNDIGQVRTTVGP